jgi:hypothetical protein
MEYLLTLARTASNKDRELAKDAMLGLSVPRLHTKTRES